MPCEETVICLLEVLFDRNALSRWTFLIAHNPKSCCSSVLDRRVHVVTTFSGVDDVSIMRREGVVVVVGDLLLQGSVGSAVLGNARLQPLAPVLLRWRRVHLRGGFFLEAGVVDRMSTTRMRGVWPRGSRSGDAEK